MTLFAIFAGLAIIAALYLTVTQLLRGSDPKAGEIRRLRGQLESLKRALDDGHIDQKTYGSRKSALTGQLADTLEAPGGVEDRSPVLAAFLAVSIPAATVALYLTLGEPAALNPANRAVTQTVTTDANGQTAAPELASAISSLQARLEENPNDVDGWVLLGQSYTAIDELEEARRAFEQALGLAPEEPLIMELLGQAIALSAPPDRVPEDARKWFSEALKRNPRSQRALFYMGFAAAQDAEMETAMGYWQTLYAQLDPNDANALALKEQMDALSARLGLPAEQATSTPAVASGRAVTVNVDVAESLWDQIETDDVLFVFARAAEGPRMPLAIARLTAGQLPATVVLDESMGMSPAMNLSSFDQVIVGARISKSGTATPQPGDLQALSDPVATDSRADVDLLISEVL